MEMKMQPTDLRVVVVEDENDSALVIHTALQFGGVQAWGVSSAEEGLALLEKVQPNLLLVDLALPGMDGWDFLKQARSLPGFANIPAIVMSAYVTRAVTQKARDAGFVACLAKPIDMNSVVEQLVEILESDAAGSPARR
jgi:CheY-like chemotaxis protein